MMVLVIPGRRKAQRTGTFSPRESALSTFSCGPGLQWKFVDQQNSLPVKHDVSGDAFASPPIRAHLPLVRFVIHYVCGIANLGYIFQELVGSI